MDLKLVFRTVQIMVGANDFVVGDGKEGSPQGIEIGNGGRFGVSGGLGCGGGISSC